MANEPLIFNQAEILAYVEQSRVDGRITPKAIMFAVKGSWVNF